MRQIALCFVRCSITFEYKEKDHDDPSEPRFRSPGRGFRRVAQPAAGLCRAFAARRPLACRYRHHPVGYPLCADPAEGLAGAGLGQGESPLPRPLSRLRRNPARPRFAPGLGANWGRCIPTITVTAAAITIRITAMPGAGTRRRTKA